MLDLPEGDGYIAGPMTGVPDFNFPLFFRTAEILAGMGLRTENPADNDGKTQEIALANALRHESSADSFAVWSSYLRRDLGRLLRCRWVCVLPGWQRSRGASLEVDVATRLGMPVYTLITERETADDFEGSAGSLPYYSLVPRVRAVGLSGYARAGKDTVGRFLVERYGYQRASFADKLREVALAVDPIVRERNNDTLRVSDVVGTLGWDEAKDTFPEIRRLLQRIGTEAGRQILGDNVWVDLAFRDLPDGARVVFTDCRFPNEAAAIARSGGEVWRVERPGFEPVNTHPSETALDDHDFDAIIYNNGDLDQLWFAVAAVHADVAA